jgi:hypothetical protein
MEKALGLKNARALMFLSMQRMNEPGAPTLEELDLEPKRGGGQ